jgi:hypothetical protein
MSDFHTNTQMRRLTQQSTRALRNGVASPTYEESPNDS